MGVGINLVDQIDALTNDYFMPTMPDLVFNQHPLLKIFSQQGTLITGGDAIRQPFMYQFSKDGAYRDYEPGSTAGENQFDAAVFPWKLYRQRVVISVPELNRNSGPEAKFRLLDAKMRGASTAIRDALVTDMYTATNVDASAGINSLNHMCDNAAGNMGSGSSTYGGVDRTAFTGWYGNAYNATMNAITYGEVLGAFFTAVDGSIHPNLFVSHPTQQFDLQNAAVAGTTAYLTRESFTNTSTLNLGYTTYTIQGQPWIVDNSCTEDTYAFWLNTNYIELVSHVDENFRWSGFMTPHDQNTRIGWIYWMGNLTCSDPSRQVGLY